MVITVRYISDLTSNKNKCIFASLISEKVSNYVHKVIGFFDNSHN